MSSEKLIVSCYYICPLVDVFGYRACGEGVMNAEKLSEQLGDRVPCPETVENMRQLFESFLPESQMAGTQVIDEKEIEFIVRKDPQIIAPFDTPKTGRLIEGHYSADGIIDPAD